jgi:hypothetical protein
VRASAIRALALTFCWIAAHAAVRAEDGGEGGGRSPAVIVRVGGVGTGQESFFGTFVVELETAHRRIGRGWDAALGLTGGWQPLLTMAKTVNSGAIVPRYSSGLTTSIAVRVSHVSSRTEAALTGHVGSSHVSPSSGIVDGVQASTAANEIGPWAAFFDVTGDVRWYPRAVPQVHRTNQSFDWVAHLFATAKHDQRFHRAGDLDGFNDPTGRIVLGCDLYPIRLIDERPQDARTWFNAGGGFEYEAAIRSTDRLPSGWKAMLVAHVDLSMLLRHASH